MPLLFALVFIDGAVAHSLRKKYGRESERYLTYEVFSCLTNALVFAGIVLLYNNAWWLETLFAVYAALQFGGFLYCASGAKDAREV